MSAARFRSLVAIAAATALLVSFGRASGQTPDATQEPDGDAGAMPDASPAPVADAGSPDTTPPSPAAPVVPTVPAAPASAAAAGLLLGGWLWISEGGRWQSAGGHMSVVP